MKHLFSTLAWECPTATERSAQVWKAAAKFAPDGTPRPTCFSGGHFCGRTPKCGIGLDGREPAEESMRSLILQIAWSAALFGAGCGSAASDAPAVANAAAPPPTSKASATVETADTVLTVSGPIIVEHQVDVTAQRDGLLSKILVDAPLRVKAGTVLARMDDRQIAANLEAARAKSRGIAAD